MMDANKTAQMEKRREKSNDARINIVHLVDFKHLGQEIVANVWSTVWNSFPIFFFLLHTFRSIEFPPLVTQHVSSILFPSRNPISNHSNHERIHFLEVDVIVSRCNSLENEPVLWDKSFIKRDKW